MITALLLASAQISPSAGTLPEDPNSDGEILVTASLLPVHSSNAPASTMARDGRLDSRPSISTARTAIGSARFGPPTVAAEEPASEVEWDDGSRRPGLGTTL